MQILDDETRASIIETIDFALRFKMQPRLRWKDEHESRSAAAAILDHLLLANAELRRGPPMPLQSPRERGNAPGVGPGAHVA